MKKILFPVLIGLFTLVFVGCSQQEPTYSSQQFVKKHLIEEFTGQGCGYCPYGMDCIHDFIGNDTNWIVVLHHYGYQADHFSVSGSKQITTKLKVSGAPSMTVDRAESKISNNTTVVFHPGYLPNVNKSQYADSTYASVVIDNEYDASTRVVKIKVSGVIGKSDYSPELKLTVLVKESGMIDSQVDYYNTFEGWEQFRHTNAVRAYLTDPLGDDLYIRSLKYSEQYELTLNAAWNAENCMVVAFITDDFQPVVQAEQKPVVAGTKGGNDITHGGIKAVEVEDYYPEPGTDIGPSYYSQQDTDTLNKAAAYYEDYSEYGFRYWTMQAYNTSTVFSINKTNCIPFAQIAFFTEVGATSLTGTYELTNTLEPGTAFAGYRDDDKVQIGGSEYYYTSLSYFNSGYLVPEAEWLIADGQLVIEDEQWSLTGHARNGQPIVLFGSTAVKNGGRASAPARIGLRPSCEIIYKD